MSIKKLFYSISLIAVITGTLYAQSSSKISSSSASPAKGWISAYTNRENDFPRWEILNRESDSLSKYIFRLLKTEAHWSEFNLCYTNKIRFLNGSISVTFRADSGHEDQGGGIVWRVEDKNNYYIARYNPLEDNLCLYYVKNAHRRLLKEVSIILEDKPWHTMKIVQRKSHYQVYLDSKMVLQGNDSTFVDAGGIGLWTKADALTTFKNLRVIQED